MYSWLGSPSGLFPQPNSSDVYPSVSTWRGLTVNRFSLMSTLSSHRRVIKEKINGKPINKKTTFFNKKKVAVCFPNYFKIKHSKNPT